MSAHKKLYLVLTALFVLFGMVAAVAQPAAAAPEAAVACKQWHIVERGEYLSKIARIYDTDWRTLAEINNLENPSRIYPGQKLCISTTGSGSGTPVVLPNTGSSASIYASSVVEDKYVTLRGKGLAADTRYSIYLSKSSSFGSHEIYAGSIYTDKYGSFTKTYNLPKKLIDVSKIYVRTVNTRSGVASSNWFINATAEGNTGGVGAPALSFSIVSVREGESVKIKTSNLPANVSFDVLIGKAGSKGVDGVWVGSLVDDEGGSVKATFEIPEKFEDRSKLDLRLENKALGIYYYLTFEN